MLSQKFSLRSAEVFTNSLEMQAMAAVNVYDFMFISWAYLLKKNSITTSSGVFTIAKKCFDFFMRM